MDYFKDAKDWITRSWYGIIIGYLIILVSIYGGIWYFIEPMDLSNDSGFLINIQPNRLASHILLSLLVAPYVTLFFIIINKLYSENKFDKLNIIYDSISSTPFDFEPIRERMWDRQQRKRIGEKAEGEFELINNVISLRRVNSEGEFHLKIRSYEDGKNKSNIIKKDLTQGGNRNVQINCQIKISGTGSQTIIFVIKDADNGDWIANKRIIVNNKNWENLSAYFRVPYDKNAYFRIDSVDVISPPNSIEIRNLRLIEY